MRLSRTIGAALQHPGNADLGFSNHRGVTVRIESGDPSIVLIAPDEATPGAPFIEVPVPAGTATVGYTVQGVAGAGGVVTITVTAPGFADGQVTVTVVQAGLPIADLSADRAVGSNDAFNVYFGIPNGGGTGLSGFQEISAAHAASLPAPELTLESSEGSVDQLSLDGGATSAVTVALELTAAMRGPGFIIVPLAGGSTTVSASVPGFMSTTAATQEATVTRCQSSVHGFDNVFFKTAKLSLRQGNRSSEQEAVLAQLEPDPSEYHVIPPVRKDDQAIAVDAIDSSERGVHPVGVRKSRLPPLHVEGEPYAPIREKGELVVGHEGALLYAKPRGWECIDHVIPTWFGSEYEGGITRQPADSVKIGVFGEPAPKIVVKNNAAQEVGEDLILIRQDLFCIK